MLRFSDEEIKHQELFHLIDRMAAAVMPPGYEFLPDPDEVAEAVLGKSTWAVLGLTCVIELFTQSHYRHSIEPEQDICRRNDYRSSRYSIGSQGEIAVGSSSSGGARRV